MGSRKSAGTRPVSRQNGGRGGPRARNADRLRRRGLRPARRPSARPHRQPRFRRRHGRVRPRSADPGRSARGPLRRARARPVRGREGRERLRLAEPRRRPPGPARRVGRGRRQRRRRVDGHGDAAARRHPRPGAVRPAGADLPADRLGEPRRAGRHVPRRGVVRRAQRQGRFRAGDAGAAEAAGARRVAGGPGRHRRGTAAVRPARRRGDRPARPRADRRNPGPDADPGVGRRPGTPGLDRRTAARPRPRLGDARRPHPG